MRSLRFPSDRRPWAALLMGALATTLALSGCKTPSGAGSALREDRSGEETGGDEAEVRAVETLVGRLAEAIRGELAEQRAAARRDLLAKIIELDSAGKLEPMIHDLIKGVYQVSDDLKAFVDAAKAAATGNMPSDRPSSAPSEAGLQATSAQIAESLASLAANVDKFTSWEQVAQDMFGKLGSEKVGDATFDDKLQSLARVPGGTPSPRFVPFSAYEILDNRPPQEPARGDRPRSPAFTRRDALIKGAKQNIWIFSWAFYEDVTGTEGAKMLIDAKKANPELDVRVMVDGATADRSGYKASIDSLQEAGIPVVRWKGPSGYRGFGFHRKMLVVDHRGTDGAVITGGLNFGDEYSHKGPSTEPKSKWRDTDVLLRGPAVARQAAQVFRKAWNNAPGVEPIAESATPAPEGAAGSDSVMIVDYEPSAQPLRKDSVMQDPIYLVTLQMIKGAKKTIEISNAYYIVTPPIQQALIEAKKRNPELVVRLHTNSDESVDLPNLVKPIYAGLPALLEAGAEVYLRRISTVHSKYMVVDGKVGWIGSYNMHPRSYRYESEVVAVFKSDKLGKELREVFAADTSGPGAKRVNEASEVTIPETPVSRLLDPVSKLFYDLL